MPEQKNFVATETQTAEESYYGTLLHEPHTGPVIKTA